MGVPTRLHPETAQCLNLEVANFFVKVDLTKDLPRKMTFNVQGEDVLVEYSYPWFPNKCVKCDTWGHSVKTCPKERADTNQEQSEVTEEGEQDEVKENKEVTNIEEKEIQDLEVEKDSSDLAQNRDDSVVDYDSEGAGVVKCLTGES